MNLDPSSLPTSDSASLLDAGIAAARSGDEAHARALLSRVVEHDRQNSTAWLWLSSVAANFADLEFCLENVAALEPDNEIIRQRLAWVKQQQAGLIPSTTAISPSEQVAAQAGTSPASAPDQPDRLDVHRLFVCPQCAGRMRFNPEIVDLQCQACGHIEVVEETRAEPPERVLSAVLRTSRGYRWASAERLLRCQQCGAQTIFPPAQTSINCPYCGNSAFGTTPEDQDLEVPQALIPMGLEADAARKKVLVWLGRGFLAPDDLTRAVLHSLQPVYVPLWLFNAAVALSPVGHDKQVYLYANWAISGIRSLPARLIKDLGSVVWKNLIEFKPEYLAGWPASTYEVSAAAAAQQARQEMEADARSRTSRLPFDLNYSPASFSTESFWLVLFPIWISSYTYRKTIYRVLVNGETGQVAGDKPFSWLKVLIVAAAVAALSGAIGFILLRTLSAMALPTELSAQLQPILDALKPVSVLLTPAIIALIAMIVLAFRK